MMLPNYDRSLLSVTSAITGFYGVTTGYPPLDEIQGALQKERTRNIILLLFDGMGSNLIKRHLPENAFLRKNRIATVTTVCPATTTAATTSLWTGLSPQEHGWLGWSLYFKELGRTIDTFMDRDSFTGERYGFLSAANTLMPFETVYKKLQPYARTHAFFPFPTSAMNGAGHKHVYKSLSGMFETMRQIASEDGAHALFAYITEPDHTMHETGVNAPGAKAMFEKLNTAAESFVKSLSPDTAVIITADHGLVDADEPVYINDIPEIYECLVMPPFVESRAASFFVKAHKRDVFKKTFEERFSKDFALFTREEVFEKNILGRGKPHRKTDDFVGDFMAFATGRKYIQYKTPSSSPSDLIGQHAGLTEDELLIDVIFARGSAQ